jgi:hypothetical protein
VRCLAATAGQNSLSGKKTVNVFGFGFLANQYHFFAAPSQQFGLVGVEHTTPACCAGRGRQALGNGGVIMLRVKSWVQQLLQ